MTHHTVDVQGEVLQKLLCDFCGLYLSAEPVLMDDKGQNMCGRCVSDSEIDLTEYLKNHVYENLASLVYFPCKNYSAGCLEKVKISNSIVHEETCKYNTHLCPVNTATKCPWTGKISEIEFHFKDSHPELVIENPYKQKPDIKSNYIQVMLFNDFNYTFLLQIRSDTSLGKFWHNVVIFAEPNIAKLFEYCVKVGKDKAYNIKSKPVKAHGNKVYEDETVAHSISYLQTDLGDFEDLNLEVRVTIKDQPCSKCHKKILQGAIRYTEHEGYLCNTCTKSVDNSLPPEERCKFHTKGCNYKTTDKFLLKKHEIYLCKAGYNCIVCGQHILERLIDHHTQLHCMLIQTHEINNVAKTTYIMGWEKLNSYAVRAHNTLFFFKVKPSRELICMELVSDTEEYGKGFFECEYGITFPGAPKILCGVLDPMGIQHMGTYDHPFDWSKYIYLPATFFRKTDFPDKINLELTITKRSCAIIY